MHENATQLANGTLTGGSVSHIGQLFWDQDLITAVEATSPYSENTATLTTNAEDDVFGEQETEDSTSDPVFNYVYIGEDLADGLFTWILVGINTSASYSKSLTVVTGLSNESPGKVAGWLGSIANVPTCFSPDVFLRANICWWCRCGWRQWCWCWCRRWPWWSRSFLKQHNKTCRLERVAVLQTIKRRKILVSAVMLPSLILKQIFSRHFVICKCTF